MSSVGTALECEILMRTSLNALFSLLYFFLKEKAMPERTFLCSFDYKGCELFIYCGCDVLVAVVSCEIPTVI